MTSAPAGAAEPREGPRRGRSSPAGTAVEKAMRVLEALAVEDGPHRLTDVAERARVPRSTAFRVLAVLGADGYAENCGDGRYGVGTRLRGLGAQGFAQNCGDGRYRIGSRLGGLGARIVRMLSSGVGPARTRL